jgi:hypothetical protein
VTDRIGQAHLLVLALHFHQQRAGAAEQSGADRLVVQERARAAVLGQHPAQHDLVVGLHPLFRQQRKHRVAERGKEAGGDRGLVGAAADQPDIGPGAQG